MSTALAPQTLLDSLLTDCATAALTSFERLRAAALNAGELLALSGNAGMVGDTADDLSIALAVHDHVFRQFLVKVKTLEQVRVYTAAAENSFDAYTDAAASQGDMPYSITVTPAPQVRAYRRRHG